MIDLKRFALNRIIAPRLSLEKFYRLAAAVGIREVELRNDLGGKDPVDGLKPAHALELAKAEGVEVATINAVQKFNLARARPQVLSELDRLLDLARSIRCAAIVLCPNNDAADSRSQTERAAETVAALAELGPRFVEAGVLGYVEPLGFAVSSLASLVLAQEAIRKSGFGCYRVVHDTFHHHIGPDEGSIIGKVYDLAHTGLVHISGVETDLPSSAYRDEHRVLVGPEDRMKSREQMRFLDGLGYRGLFSFEPFSPAIQQLGEEELAAALKRSLAYLIG